MADRSSLEQLSLLAGQGDLAAMEELGKLLWADQPPSARLWLERAVGLGSWSAADALATLTSAPEESEGWRRVTVDLAQRDVDNDDVDAMIFLAWLRQDDDLAQAIALSRRAAQTGSVEAMGQLAYLLSEIAPEEAEQWGQRASAAGDANGLAQRAYQLERTDPDGAISLYKLAATKGQRYAMERLGAALESRGEEDEARQWYQQAAEAGLVSAMTDLGRLLFYTDRDESLTWIRRAAESGDVPSMRTLAAGLEFRDWDEAIVWLQRACTSGDKEACNILVGMAGQQRWPRRIPLIALSAEMKSMRKGRRARRGRRRPQGKGVARGPV